jgi:hypothetical protein
MGWLFMPRSSMGGHATPKAYLDAQFTYTRDLGEGRTSGLRVLASACVGNRVYYAAVQAMENGRGGEIVAAVCLVRWNPRSPTHEHFGYKSMDESMGPCEADCPARILDLLSPTSIEYALDWRARCRANLARRARKLEHGDMIRMRETMTFTDGHVGDLFIVEKQGRKLVLVDPETRGRYRISRFMERDWSVVPVTRIHKTVFA